MKTPSLRSCSVFLFSGALVAALAGTSCDEAEPEDLALEESLEERSGGHDDDDDDDDDEHHDGGHHGDGHHGDKCDGDHEPPKFKTKPIKLWPPNHKLHEIKLADCIKEVKTCDGKWDVKVLSVTSDEKVNDEGDGNTEPDIKCGDDKKSVKLRAERSGKKDGRVYKIKFKVKDHHHKKTYGICRVEVPHDQGKNGDAVDSGPAYEVKC